MEEFKELSNAILESVNSSSATYVGESESQKVQGVSLNFDFGWFVIENPSTVFGANGSYVSLKTLVGDQVQFAGYDEEEIRIVFISGAHISISLKDEDFVGPEAASFSPKKGDIVVFN